MKTTILASVTLLGAITAHALGASGEGKSVPSHRFKRGDAPLVESRDVKHRDSFIWSGGEVEEGTRYASVSAEVVIPNITFPYGYNSTAYYSSSVWVGIGGDQNACDDRDLVYNGGLIQGGYYYLYDKEGDFGVFAFYEWWPNPPIFLDNTYNITTDIGDHVRMSVTQKDNTTGTFTWENFTQDKRFEIDLTAPVNGTLCTNHAEWIIESFMTRDTPDAYFPDFGELTFTNIKAVSESGKAASLADAYVLDAQPLLNGRYLTSCDVIVPDSTTCKWLGYEGIFDNTTSV